MAPRNRKPDRKKNTTCGELAVFHKRLKNALPHDAIVRSKGAWGTSLNKRLEAIWIAKSIACQYVSKSYNRNSQKFSNYKIKIHFRVNSIAFIKEKDYTNYEGKLTVWFLICQEAAKMDEAKMVLSYNKLWKMLIDRKLKKKDLQKMTHLSSSVIAKMGRDESVHLDTIVKICIALQCDISDVVTLCNKEA